MTPLELFALANALYFVYLYNESQYFIANNIIAFCFTIYAIENWLIGNFRNIFLVFAGLIAYDVYFVFHTDVMMTVAKGLDLPLKILLPLNGNQKSFAMIGLGDIVIPGLFSSLCLRCDVINAFKIAKSKAQKEGVRESDKMMAIFEKELGCFYFNASLFGFFVGLAVTYSAMTILQSPQPALLYILPSMLVIYFAGAFGRKEFFKMI